MKKKLAKTISDVLNPFLVSAIVMVLLSFDSTASIADGLKWSLISVTLSVLPVLAVVVYLVRRRKLDGLFINPRRQRNKVYLLATAFAVISCAVLRGLGAPSLLVATFVAGLVAIFVFMVINLRWKISLHTGFIAASVTVLTMVYGTTGALAAVLIPPVAWARMEMKLHSLAQVVSGALLSAAMVIVVFRLFGLPGAHI